MSKFAVIKINTSQYNIQEGSTYTVPKIQSEIGKLVVSDVLIAGDEKVTNIGKPLVENAKVELEILSQEKGEKVTSRIFKAKSRYRRTRGFRKSVTIFKVNSIKF